MLQKKYQPNLIENKWQEKWREEGLYKYDQNKKEPKYYTLVELPYPSGDLHLGHWFAFSPADAHARYKKMSGYNVFFPNGFDAFGLPAENAAIKRSIHPRDWTMHNIKTMRSQFDTMGTMIDWSHEAITCLPEYYKWNQWIFIKMWEKDLVYRSNSLSNWCPSCQTVLANENIENGKCWRCGTEVVQKQVAQWFLKITDYADKLLWDNTDQELSNGVAWPKQVREGQNNWIGKSEGALIEFPLKNDYNYILLHGFNGTSDGIFFPWLKNKLDQMGLKYKAPNLPNSSNPSEEEQVEYILKNISIDNKTILFGHSLGAVTALKVAQKLDKKIGGLVLAGGFLKPEFKDNDNRPFKDTYSWDFNFDKINKNIGFIKILSELNDYAVPIESGRQLHKALGGELIEVTGSKPHFTGDVEPVIFKALIPSLEVFTTRPDTLYGATFMVVSPEHPMIQGLIAEENKELASKNPHVQEVREYAELASKKTELERKESKQKSGVFTGLIAVNPVNRQEIPIWVADYVLIGYGTGVIMAVPAHDDRDFDFAKKYDLPINYVIKPYSSNEERSSQSSASNNNKKPYVGDGAIINSGDWDGLKVPDEIGKVIDDLAQKGLAKKKIEYHLHDWSISRQRYWGTPVPMIHCRPPAGGCGTMPVPIKDLPIELPYEVDYTPKGKPPLATDERWLNIKCPECGGPAKRDAETLDTFFDSAWYYYRYVSPNYNEGPFDKLRVKELLPVDAYFGGAEHTLGHTLYARFFTKFFKDLGLIDFDEFAKRRIQHGVILGPDGFRMSKSRGNVVNPDDVVKLYGADTVRLYLCFMMPYEATSPWDPGAITGVFRFLKRIWDLSDKVDQIKDLPADRQGQKPMASEDLYEMHKTIKKVGEDLSEIKFNTAVAALMEWLNHLSRKDKVSLIEYKTLILLLAPFAPHISEELWQMLKPVIASEEKQSQDRHVADASRDDKEFDSIHLHSWPEFDEKYLVEDTVTIVIQVNGRVRDSIQVSSNQAGKKVEVEQLAKQKDNVKKYLDGKEIKKVVYVERKILSFVVS